MPWTTQARIRVGFWLLALVPIVLGFLGYATVRNLIESSEWVARTNEGTKQLETVFSLLKDVEVAQREFVVSGLEEYLGPYRAARRQTDEELAKLRRLISANPDQRPWLVMLDELIPQKFEEMEKTIELRHSEGFEVASQVMLSQRGFKAMDDIRTVIRNMMREQKEMLDKRTSQQRRNLTETAVLMGAVLVVNVALTWVLFWMIGREQAERRAEEQRMRALNLELERRVQQRTEALRRSNQDLQQFAYIASHDLQEPLRMVGSYVDLLQRRYQGKLDPEADEFIRYAVDGVSRMSALITALLEYSRADEVAAGEVKTLDAREVLEAALQNLKVRIDEAAAEITWDRLPAVHTDQLVLLQVFQNLIGNALKYRSQGPPRIHVSAVSEQDELVFSVRDNGIGIDPKYQDKVFGVFQRLHGREYEGTGIGLATCKKLVERQGGRIWFESEPGEGSTFYFSLPQRQPALVAHAS